MFLVWFFIAGAVLGLLRRGRILHLDRLRLRAPWLILLALLIQALIFPWGEREPIIKAGTGYLHLLSYVALVAFVCLNRRYQELLLIGAGILCNLIVIAANGGYMPVSPFALHQAGRDDLAALLQNERASGNVILMGPDTRLNFLGDVLFLPPWLPFATAFSLGDLLLGIGVLTFLAGRGEPGARERNGKSLVYSKLLHELIRAQTVPRIAQAVLRHAIRAIPGADAGSFLFHDPGEETFRYVATEGWDLGALKELRFAPGELPQVLIGKGEEICVVKDPRSILAERAPHVLKKLGSPEVLPRAFISVPIRYEGEIAGYLNIESRNSAVFGEEALHISEDFRDMVELALAIHLSREELKENEPRARALFEDAPDAIYITDYEGNILDCNKAATEQTGYTREELLRMNIARDLAVDPPPMGPINERLERGERVVFEEKKRRKDGTFFYTEVALSPLAHHGRKVVFSLNRDITWRKQHETKIYQLWRLSRELFSSKDAEELAQKAVRFCVELFRARYCGLYFLRDGVFRLVASYRHPDLTVSLPQEVKSVAELTSDDVPQGHLLRTPIALAEKRLGIFVVATPEEVTEYHRRLAELLSLQVANALQATEYTRRIREFADRLEKLHHASMRFHKVKDEKEMCAVAVEVLKELLGFDYASIDFREGDYLVPMCYSARTPFTPRPFKITEGLTGLTYREKRTIWGEDVRRFPEARPVDAGIRSFISVPIGDLGVIQVVSQKVGAFSLEDVKLVEILAQQMYEALKRMRLEREIREQAVKDPLTGLYNRRYLDLFVALYRRSEEKPISLAILDLDGFKGVNDRFGHAVGDEVLAAVGALLRGNTRSDDVVIRWGGDEFLILMPKTEVPEARKVVARLGEVMASWKHPRHPEIKLRFTAGIAAWDPRRAGIDEALREADAELYARRNRRRGACFAEGGGENKAP